MKVSPRSIVVTSVILLVLVFSAVRPMTARADDAAPPLPDSGETIPADPAASDATDVAPAPSDAAPVTTEPAPADTTEAATTVTDAAAPTDVAEVLSQVPDGTGIVAVDGSGEALPLASQQAANALSAGDPSFTVGGVTYGFTGGGSCPPAVTNCTTGSTNPIQDAINWLSTNQTTPDDGNVYVEADTYTNDVNVDGNTWGSGFTPAYLGLIGAGSGSTTLNGYLNIFHMNDFTLSGFAISGDSATGTYVNASNNDGTLAINDVDATNTTWNNGGNGIMVINHAGDISMSDVTANGSNYDGVYLDNTDGQGKIKVERSQFNGNSAGGLEAYSNGDISLLNVVANANAYGGAFLDNCNTASGSCTGSGSIDVGSSVFGDSSIANGNGQDGLVAFSNGDISLINTTASYNQTGGAFLLAAGDINTTSSTFDWNQAGGDGYTFFLPAGLVAGALGNLALSDVQANNNNFLGAGLASENDVTLDQSTFDSNAAGLIVLTNGDVSFSLVSASNNQMGAVITAVPSWLSYSGFGFEYAAPVNGTVQSLSVVDSTFNNNRGEPPTQTAVVEPVVDPMFLAGVGLLADMSGTLLSVTSPEVPGGDFGILGGGDISLLRVTASGNSLAGALLLTAGNITVDSSIFNNNGDFGFVTISDGNVTVSCSDLEDNGLFGVAAIGRGVLGTNSDTFAGNGVGDVLLVGGSQTDNPDFPCGGGAHDPHHPLGTGALLPWNTIQVAGGETNALECSLFSGTVLVLPNGDRVRLPCPIGDNASLTGVGSDKLPGTLDSKFTFVSAMNPEVTPGPLGGTMTVEFLIPPDKQGAIFSVLYWDGSKWEDLGGTATADGFFAANAGLTGHFVLVTE
jgi:putative surface-exposed virulence protein